MKLFTIVIAIGIIDFASDLSYTTFDRVLLSSTADHDRVLAGDRDLLDAAQITQLNGFQVDSQIFENRFAVRQRRNIAKDRLTTITVSRSLYRSDAQNTSHLIDNESRQRVSFNIFSDHQQRLLRLADRFEKRNHLFVIGDLLFMDQDIAVFQFDRHLILIGYEVRREEASIKLHAFNNFNCRFTSTTFFDSDHAILANLQERIRQNITDRWVIVASNGRNLFDLFLVLSVDRNGNLVDLTLHNINSLCNTAG